MAHTICIDTDSILIHILSSTVSTSVNVNSGTCWLKINFTPLSDKRLQSSIPSHVARKERVEAMGRTLLDPINLVLIYSSWSPASVHYRDGDNDSKTSHKLNYNCTWGANNTSQRFHRIRFKIQLCLIRANGLVGFLGFIVLPLECLWENQGSLNSTRLANIDVSTCTKHYVS